MRFGRFSTLVASNNAEVVFNSIEGIKESKFEIVSVNGSLNDLRSLRVGVSELVVAHVVAVHRVFTSSSVLPLNSDLVVTTFTIGI